MPWREDMTCCAWSVSCRSIGTLKNFGETGTRSGTILEKLWSEKQQKLRSGSRDEESK